MKSILTAVLKRFKVFYLFLFFLENVLRQKQEEINCNKQFIFPLFCPQWPN